ncbi:hypothetical protein [Ruicaihuangia caeni]|uniref:Right handed beta helix domain-containing protein n=1 Tax=Ruicaihuangia caeni TaxID=3042517 RepID=A0AAW6T5J0_9MICO|nr:hypothetical protein [Klugiella sp. YN-L-19]MDI2097609.1 hypothetical protein [Klugiella sp. YN-L-19]
MSASLTAWGVTSAGSTEASAAKPTTSKSETSKDWKNDKTKNDKWGKGKPSTGTPSTDSGTTEPDSTTDVNDSGSTETDSVVATEPTPAPAPAPEPAPAPAPAPAPTGGVPSASTTGVPAGTTLSAMSGLTITTPGTVLDARHIKGNVTIAADNVTIKNSLIEGLVNIRPPYKGLLLQRVEIAGPGTSAAAYENAVGYSNFTCDGCNVHGWGKGFMMDNNVTVKNSWVHDLVVSGDPAGSGSHNETILSLGGSNFTIVNNRLDSGRAGNFSASIALYNQWGPIKDTLVQGNLMNGGGYCLYAGYDVAGKNHPSNLRIVDNTFGTSVSPKCGSYGPAVAFYSGNGNVWSGNAMQGGAAVAAPKGGM